MKSRIILVILLLCQVFLSFSQKNYEIKFNFQNYDNDSLLLAYFYADRQLIQDTIIADQNGEFVYTGEDTLKSGVYILMFFPGKDYIQFIVDEKDAFFTLSGDYKDLSRPDFVGSLDNELFYGYMDFIKEMRTEADLVNNQRKEAKLSGKDTLVYDGLLEVLDQRVKDLQDSLVLNYPESMTTLLIKGNMDVVVPEIKANEQDLQRLRFYYYRDHFFDHIDLGDPRVLRTPFVNNKLMRYLDNLTVQMPDSIVIAVDELLKRMEPAEETWKFYVANFLNKYGKMQIIGMDKVYVHMVDTYYATGRTPWADEETLAKIIDNAEKLRPVLIGNIAPDVTLHTEDNIEVRLHDIEAPLTVLLFWAPDCGHCKTSLPIVLEFNEKFKDKGVKTIGICTKHMDKTDSCWEYVKEKEMEGLFYNLADKYHKSRFQLKYNIRTTPQIFVLDENKEIILKRIAAEKLDEVMTQIITMKEQSGE